MKSRTDSPIDRELVIAEMADGFGNIHKVLSSGRNEVTTPEGDFIEYIPTDEDIHIETIDEDYQEHKVRYDGLVEVTRAFTGEFICYRPVTDEDFAQGEVYDSGSYGPYDEEDVRLREEGFELDEYGAAVLDEDEDFPVEFRESVAWDRTHSTKWFEEKTHPGYDDDGNPIPGYKKRPTEAGSRRNE